MIKKIWKSAIASIYWVKALKYSSKGEHEKSLRYLLKTKGFVKPDVEFYVLRGLLEALNKNYHSSIKYSSLAVELIDANENLNDNEKEYLKYFSRKIMLKSSKILGYENSQLEDELRSPPKILTSSIRKGFLVNYPVKEIKA